MSTYQESWNAVSAESASRSCVPQEFSEEFPGLATVFSGVSVGKGEQGGVPPATINLWFEGGDLHFCIMPRSGNRIAFGVISDPCKGLAGLEAEISQGRFGWRQGKNRRTA